MIFMGTSGQRLMPWTAIVNRLRDLYTGIASAGCPHRMRDDKNDDHRAHLARFARIGVKVSTVRMTKKCR
jgi:hypothetical protein